MFAHNVPFWGTECFRRAYSVLALENRVRLFQNAKNALLPTPILTLLELALYRGRHTKLLV